MRSSPHTPTERQRLSGRPPFSGVRKACGTSIRGYAASSRLTRQSMRDLTRRPMATAADKRRIILDAAVRVFARQGFNGCRVSDIADEAGVAYGLVYHYFRSKDEVLDTLFLERWNVLLEVIRELDATDSAPREKLHA